MYPKRRWTDEVGVTRADFNQRVTAFQRVREEAVNWVVRMAREVAYRCRIAVCAPSFERATEIERERAHAERERLAEDFAQGYLDGWHECYALCLEAVEDEVSRKSDIWAAGELLTESERSLKTN